jgi:signal transduction histidine kinase
LDSLVRVGQCLVTAVDLDQLLADIVDLTASVMRASAAALLLIDEEKPGELVYAATLGRREAHRLRVPVGEGSIPGWVAAHGEPVVSNNVTRDARFNRRLEDLQTGFLTYSIAAVPLVRDGRIIGVLEARNADGDGFGEKEIQLMHTLAAQVAIAIENARVLQTVRDEQRRTIHAQEGIRQEVARSLHDGPVQMLASIAMGLDHLRLVQQFRPEAFHAELDRLYHLVQQATREARLAVFGLRPLVLEAQGLVPALCDYVAQLNEAGEGTETIAVYFAPGDVGGDLALGPHAPATIFSIVQEAVNNARRHAAPQNIWVVLRAAEDNLCVAVRDDGLGFDVADVAKNYARRGSLGLLNMREWAEMVGGVFRISSRTEPPNQGTMVRVDVPLKKLDNVCGG